MKKRLFSIFIVLSMVLCLAGCDIAGWESGINDIKGQLVGNSFECQFYDNYGEKFLTASGTKVGMTGNIIEDSSIDSNTGVSEAVYSLSSVVTINIDGKQIESCGDTIIFEENGLNPDAEFQLNDIKSSTDGSFSENTSISNVVNAYKNFFGKGR